jgi:hypothetical protein
MRTVTPDTGGFWGGGAAQYGIYLPLVLRNY